MARRPILLFLFLGFFTLSLTPRVLQGQVLFEGERSRIYLGLGFAYNSTTGKSFDGESAFFSSGQFIPVPKLKAAPGFNAVLGLRGENIGIELSYLYFSHDGTLKDPTLAEGESRGQKVGNHGFNIDLKGHFWPGSRLEGYFQIGLAVSFLSVDKSIFGTEDSVWKIMGNAVYQSAGLDLGVGMDFWLNRRIGLTTGLFYRPLFFSTLKESLYETPNVMGTLDVDLTGMKGHSLGLTAGILVNLK